MTGLVGGIYAPSIFQGTQKYEPWMKWNRVLDLAVTPAQLALRKLDLIESWNRTVIRS
jgi:hypothetical protein